MKVKPMHPLPGNVVDRVFSSLCAKPGSSTGVCPEFLLNKRQTREEIPRNSLGREGNMRPLHFWLCDSCERSPPGRSDTPVLQPPPATWQLPTCNHSRAGGLTNAMDVTKRSPKDAQIHHFLSPESTLSLTQQIHVWGSRMYFSTQVQSKIGPAWLVRGLVYGLNHHQHSRLLKAKFRAAFWDHCCHPCLLPSPHPQCSAEEHTKSQSIPQHPTNSTPGRHLVSP